MSFSEHKAKWSDCNLCELCSTRQRVIFVRGTIPCDILFVGEAPGVSEDILGKPFAGPAGKLLDKMIERAQSRVHAENISWAITNLIGCIPIGEDGAKVDEPSKEHIETCSAKLYEFISIAKPKAIVAVGKLAEIHVNPIEITLRKNKPEVPEHSQYVAIMHPAAILRADVSSQDLFIQRCVATLEDLFSDLIIPF